MRNNIRQIWKTDRFPENVVNKPADHQRPGFRFSLNDALVLLVSGIVAVLLWKPLPHLSVLLLFVIGHFFLFCNVFRVRRNYEYLWGAVFVVNAMLWLLLRPEGFHWALWVQLPVTAGVIVAEVRSERYHGIGCGGDDGRLGDNGIDGLKGK